MESYRGVIQGKDDEIKVNVMWDKTGTGTIQLNQKLLTTGCEDSTFYTAVIVDNPEKPTITKDDNKLISSALSGNQWYLNNQIMQNEINQILYPSESGLYQVQTTINGCSSEKSENYDYVINSVDDFELFKNVNIYPNPIDNVLKIDLLNSGLGNIRISVIDVLGAEIFKTEINEFSKQFSIKFDSYPAGIYFITINNCQNSCLRKIIKK
jgi:hypothetical protein